MSEQTLPRTKPWYFLPSVIIVAGCLVAMVNFGIRSSFGLFTGPISEAHGWPRETYSIAIAIQNLLWGIATPISGALADRYGSARVLMGGAVFYAVGTALMAGAASPAMLHFSGGILIGIGIAASSFGIVMAAFGRLVPPEKRSWAFGIATAAGSLGQFIFAPLGGALIPAFGWYQALLILAACALLMIIFAFPLMAQNTSKSALPPGEAEMTLRQAIKAAFGNRSYNLLTAGFFVCGFQLAFVTVHLPPYLQEHGISAGFAGLAMGAIGLFNVAGSYYSGIIGGRHSKRIPLSIIYLLRSIAIVAFILLPVTDVTTIIFTASMGLLWLSTVPLTMGLVTVLFGTRYMATLYGFVFLSHQVGSFFGVWLGGRLYDQFGSYDPVWWMGAALGVFAAIIHLPIREQRSTSFVQPAPA
ncbi:MFS transporter [Taklimakanibacter deserti]|uniref:MFS transporter n=1 Tax=Taklimakanibacter deserti TaxID=2267839 RepID=UPI000E65C4FB